jgi:D-sedoheptulose 7-phosphate isomerase
VRKSTDDQSPGERLAIALPGFDAHAPRLQAWGADVAKILTTGGQVVTCPAPGAEDLAQLLASSLGRDAGDDRPALAATALTADSGRDLAELVRSHCHFGDIAIFLTAGTPPADLIEAARTARDLGMTTRTLTGPEPGELADICTECIAVAAAEPPSAKRTWRATAATRAADAAKPGP